MALGSTREVQGLLDLFLPTDHPAVALADHLGAAIWRLLQRPGELRVEKSN